MIVVRGLVKRFGAQRAVDDVDLDVRPGEVLALLGPNGAGKSTIIKSIVGLVRPTAGRVRVAGHDVQRAAVAAKGAIGYVPDRPYLYPKLTGRELLRFVGRLRRLSEAETDRRAHAWLERFGLDGVANEIVETYSHGMRQKLTFAAALLPDPPVLVVDEPMVGLDPRAARLVRDLMSDHAARGRAVLLTTHAMEVAEAVAHRVVVLHRGRVAAEGSLAELRAGVGLADADLEAVFLQLTEEAAAPLSAVPV